MSRWRLVQIPEAEVTPTDLTDSELIGINIMLTYNAGKPLDEELNVYWRARQKIQGAVQIARNRTGGW